MPKAKKNADEFYCEFCDFICSKESNFNKHLSTRKHKIRTDNTKNATENSPFFECDCGKKYKHASSLWNHKQKDNCIYADKTDTTTVKNMESRADTYKLEPELVKGLFMQNQELIREILKKDELVEQMIHKIGTTNITNNTHNTQNNNFNINLFLNEQCKDAINFSDFIDRIEVSHEDLENNAELGFVNGISKILMDNLKQLTVHERPIHCTDVKRETMYIKDDDEWKKDKNTNTQKLNDAIHEVSRKSMISLMDWKRTNPDYQDGDSEFSTKCIAMQQQSTAITKKEQYYPKVVHKIAKESAIDKSLV